MILKNRIIAGTLCMLIVGIGFFGGVSDTQAQTLGTLNGTAPTTIATIEQLQQMVQSLTQQIQQLIQLIAQLKPRETCGNGICRFGETATTCPSDCGQNTGACAKEGEKINITGSKNCCLGFTPRNSENNGAGDCMGSDCDLAICVKKSDYCVAQGYQIHLDKYQECCPGLTYGRSGNMNSALICKKIESCGDGICSGAIENMQNCPSDCGKSGCSAEGKIVGGKQNCCAGLKTYIFNGKEEEKNGICIQNGKVWDNGYSFSKCIKCGDGKCNSLIGENVCNCSADCATMAKTELLIWPDANSFDLVEKTFSGEIAINHKIIKILTTDTTKIYQQATWDPNWKDAKHYTFAEFQALIKNWTGPKMPFTVKGITGAGGILTVDEIIMIVQ
ncbi:MAG: hypothetical protein WCX69_01925 [Candidatus Paceibacterota bacterium]